MSLQKGRLTVQILHEHAIMSCHVLLCALLIVILIANFLIGLLSIEKSQLLGVPGRVFNINVSKVSEILR